MFALSRLFEDSIDTLIRKVDRADFLPSSLKSQAYSNRPLPIECEQTTSAPSLIKDILKHLRLNKTKNILEIGTGSGWQTVLMAKLSNHVFSIEINPTILKTARSNINKYHVHNVSLKLGNGLKGWEDHAPFDAIVISAAVDHVPKDLLEQLTSDGFMIAPVVFGNEQKLLKISKNGTYKVLENVRFVKIQK